MAKTISIELSNSSLDSAIKELKQYAEWVDRKTEELRTKLAEVGADVARVEFAGAIFDGTNDVTVRVDNTGSMAVVYAEGTAVLFIEFGSGIKYGYGHPQAGTFGFGPGTWSDGPEGRHHWDDPNGWYYEHGEKSYGNPPAMAMLSARNAIVEQYTKIAREVFSR